RARVPGRLSERNTVVHLPDGAQVRFQQHDGGGPRGAVRGGRCTNGRGLEWRVAHGYDLERERSGGCGISAVPEQSGWNLQGQLSTDGTDGRAGDAGVPAGPFSTDGFLGVRR